MTPHDWSTLYLTCFIIGLVLSALSFFTGALHLHIGSLHIGHHAPAKAGSAQGSANHHSISWLNAFTLTGFLCWFGAAGYLFHRYTGFVPVLVFVFAMLCGLAGAGILLWFLTGVLLRGERTLEAADTEIVGVLGRLSQPIVANGVGEMLYQQNGARRSMPVRSMDGSEIPRDAEVVVMSWSKGVAYVRRWSEFEQSLLSGDEPTSQDKELREP